jgi:hypothetical protein
MASTDLSSPFPVRLTCRGATDFDPRSGYHELLEFEVFNTTERVVTIERFGLDITMATTDEWHEFEQASAYPSRGFPLRLEPNDAIRGAIHIESLLDDIHTKPGTLVGWEPCVDVGGYGRQTTTIQAEHDAHGAPRLAAGIWRRLVGWTRRSSDDLTARDHVVVGLLIAAIVAVVGGVYALAAGALGEDTKAPVSMTVDVNPAASDPTELSISPVSFWFPRTLAGLGRAPGSSSAPSDSCRQWRPWALANGGYDAGTTRMDLFVQAHAGSAVVVEGMDVSVRRRPRARGVNLICPSGGATPNRRRIFVNLDRDPPQALYAGIEERPNPRPLQFTLRETETEILEVSAYTRRCLCTWRGSLRLLVNGRRMTLPIDDHGEPFRTAATGHSDSYVWESSGWRRYPERSTGFASP